MIQQREQKVTLGCGTLILIALIVLIFSNAGNDEVRLEFRQLELKISNLEKAVATQSDEIARLRKSIERSTVAKEARSPARAGSQPSVEKEAPASVEVEER